MNRRLALILTLMPIFGLSLHAQSAPSASRDAVFGVWRDENSVMAFKPNSELVFRWDTGEEAYGIWKLTGNEFHWSFTCRKSRTGGVTSGVSESTAIITELGPNAFRYREGGTAYSATRLPVDRTPSVDNIAKAVCDRAVAATTSAPKADEAFDQLKRENATRVTALLGAIRAIPPVSPAFARCVTSMSTLITSQTVAMFSTRKANSSSKSEIARFDQAQGYSTQVAPIDAEAVCAWKVIAWQNGMVDFNPAQFQSNPRMGQLGQAQMLGRIFNLQCREAGDAELTFSNRSIACANDFADKALAALRSGDLTDTAYRRLASLLLTELPPELALFRGNAITGYGYSRYSREQLTAICSAKC